MLRVKYDHFQGATTRVEVFMTIAPVVAMVTTADLMTVVPMAAVEPITEQVVAIR